MRLVSHLDDWFFLAVVPNSDSKCVYNSRRRLRVCCPGSLSLSAHIFYACLCVRLQNIKPMCNYANAQRRRRLWHGQPEATAASYDFPFSLSTMRCRFTATAVANVAFCLRVGCWRIRALDFPPSTTFNETKEQALRRKTEGNLIASTAAFGEPTMNDDDGVGSVIKMFANLLHNTSY